MSNTLKNKYYYHIQQGWISDQNFNSNNLIGYITAQKVIMTQLCLEYELDEETTNTKVLESFEAPFIALYENFALNTGNRIIKAHIYSEEKNLIGEYEAYVNPGNLSTLQSNKISFTSKNNKAYFIIENTGIQKIFIAFSSPLKGIKLTGGLTFNFTDDKNNQKAIYQCLCDSKYTTLSPTTKLLNQLPPVPTEIGKIFIWRDRDTKKPPQGNSEGYPNKHYILDSYYYLSPIDVKVGIWDENGQKLSDIIVLHNALIYDPKANPEEGGQYTFSAPSIPGYSFKEWTDNSIKKEANKEQIRTEVITSSNYYFSAQYSKIQSDKNNNKPVKKYTTLTIDTENGLNDTIRFYGDKFYLPANYLNDEGMDNGSSQMKLQRVQYYVGYYDIGENYYSPFLPYSSDDFSNVEYLKPIFFDNLSLWPTFYKIDDYNWAPVDLYAKGSDIEWRQKESTL